MGLELSFINVCLAIAVVCLVRLSWQQDMPAMTTTALFPRANYPKVTVATTAAWIYTAVSECRAKIRGCSSNGGSGRHTIKCCHESIGPHISIARFKSIGLSGCQCSSECTCSCPEWLFDVKLYGLSVRCRVSAQYKRERAHFRQGPVHPSNCRSSAICIIPQNHQGRKILRTHRHWICCKSAATCLTEVALCPMQRSVAGRGAWCLNTWSGLVR